ncbi:MAG: hypothetical protein KatS3mg024_0680 [Armatimonadota bacterium]|nr:MAG: hypothetical protein KatS3mg024_0680 [Armatimonadota bacterium]
MPSNPGVTESRGPVAPLASTAKELDALMRRLVLQWGSIRAGNIASFAGYFCRCLGLCQIPRDPLAVLVRLGVRVEPALLPRGVKAVWCRTSQGYAISYSRHLAGKVSLALWHELFEILAHNPQLPLRLSLQDQERLASLFAVNVMMPGEEVRRQAAELGHPRRTNKSRVLAARFGVSAAAMRFRLRQLGLEHPSDAAQRAVL